MRICVLYGPDELLKRTRLHELRDAFTAEHGDMPHNVILAGWADRVLAPEDMPATLLAYVRGALPRLERAEDLARQGETDLEAILAVLRTSGRHDFSPYKRSTLVRRILRRMSLGQVESFRHYADRLRGDAAEVRALVGDLMINVTGFFRDPEAWRTLERKVVAPLVQSREDGQQIRAWVPACSSGEEAYSIAMLLLMQAEDSGKKLDIKVFATDAAQSALARARTGLFAGSVAETMPAAWLRRFFDKERDVYRAKKELREVLVFAPQNLLSDPPFSRLDLVSCRNLLIYLQPPIQERVIALLHFSLRPDGHLFLGTAETVGRTAGLFDPVSSKWRIYRRVGETRHDLVDFPLLGAEHVDTGKPRPEPMARRTPREEAREALLAGFAPPAVLIDDRHRAIYFHGDLEPYLTTPAGEPTRYLLALLREELRGKLRAMIRKATSERTRVSAEVRLGEGPGRSVRLVVAPAGPVAPTPHFLVSFLEQPEAPLRGAPAADEPADGQSDLEGELNRLREELRLSVEQLENSNEELKASNEEITSMNEELQSTNEEMETSKEELQSLNEELNTVNSQLQSKVEELEDRTNDLNNLLNSTDIATLFLDREFRIRWFTPQIRTLFQVIQSGIGRPIADFAQCFEDAGFLKDARAVLRGLQPLEREVLGADGRWHLRRTLPYRTSGGEAADGIVITFTDITERRNWEQALSTAKAFAERIVNTTRQPLVVLNDELVVRSANRAFYEGFQLTREQVEGRLLFDIDEGDWNNAELRQALRDAVPQDAVRIDLEVEHGFRKLGRRQLLVSARRIEDEALILLAIEDVTERARASANREVLVSELHHRVKNLLTKVQAIVRLSRRGATSLDEFAAGLTDRIGAIARSEELIGGRVEGIALRELIEAETAGVSTQQPPRIEGPEVRLSSDAAQILALALHELSTNAVKYGAFSKPEGRLLVEWSVSEGPEPVLSFHWRESGVPIAADIAPSFGSRLIKDMVPAMLGGRSEWNPTPDGVECLLEVPLSEKVSLVPESASG
ncbi:MAG: CheR family methyltransferase [Tistlia sp.]